MCLITKIIMAEVNLSDYFIRIYNKGGGGFHNPAIKPNILRLFLLTRLNKTKAFLWLVFMLTSVLNACLESQCLDLDSRYSPDIALIPELSRFTRVSLFWPNI